MSDHAMIAFAQMCSVGRREQSVPQVAMPCSAAHRALQTSNNCSATHSHRHDPNRRSAVLCDRYTLGRYKREDSVQESNARASYSRHITRRNRRSRDVTGLAPLRMENPHVEHLKGALVLVGFRALCGHGGPQYTTNPRSGQGGPRYISHDQEYMALTGKEL